MENINNTELPPIQTPPEPQLPPVSPQPIDTPITPPPIQESINQNEKKTGVGFYIISIIVILFLISACYVLAFRSKDILNLITKKNDDNPISQTSKITPTTIPTKVVDTVTPIANDITKDWKTYTDSKIGFIFKYPNIISLGQDDTKFKVPYLYIEILNNKISNQESKQTLEKGQLVSAHGLLLKSDPDTRKIIKIDNKINAQTWTVLRETQEDGCIVGLTRKMIFYQGEYQTEISYTYHLGESLIPSKYLTTDNVNCGNNNIWKSQEEFYKDISSNQLENKILQNWFNDFDKIISTIKFN